MFVSFRLRKWAVFAAAAGVLVFVLLCTGAAPGGSRQSRGLSLPVVMYHGFAEETDKQNQYMISPDRLEEDLRYLCGSGYHTILLSELIRYIEEGEPLPEKPVLLTFDDGYLSNYRYAFPLLKKYRCKAVISPIGQATDDAENDPWRNGAYAQCSWEELDEMCRSGLVELQNHTYGLHRIQNGVQGAERRPDESIEDYEIRLTEDLQHANRRIAEKTGTEPLALTLPFGAGGDEAREVARKMGFRAVLDCEERHNEITDGESLFHLHRFLRPNDLSAREFFEQRISGVP